MGASLRLTNLSTVPALMHYDEAANGLLTQNIAFHGYHPIFISSFTGQETLFFYVAAGIARLIGSTPFALRFASVVFALLTIASTYWLGREWRLDRRICLLAATLLAVSFWHVLISRIGFRAISEPPLQALTLAALFRGLRRQDGRWLALAGLFLGLTGYTYLAARLFPVLLVLGCLPFLLNRAEFPKRWGQLILVTAVAFVVLLPLLYYFQQHPDAFWVRIDQVAPSSSQSVFDSFWKSLGMLFVKGDPYWRFNWAGRPLFDWFWGGLLVVGWATCLTRYNQVALDWQKSTLLFLLIAPFIMILPTALAVNEIVPSNLRALGLIPFIFFLPAIGFLDVADSFTESMPEFTVTQMALAAVALLLTVNALFINWFYLNEWAHQAEPFYQSDGDLGMVANYLNKTFADTDFADTSLYVAAPHYRHPTLAFLSPLFPHIKWLTASEVFVIPPAGKAWYLFPYNSPLPTWLPVGLLPSAPTVRELGPDGDTAFVAYGLNQPLKPLIPHEVEANFGGALRLLGYEYVPNGEDALSLTLYWQVTAVPPTDTNYTTFVHLEDAWKYRWSQVESFGYPVEQWQVGETILQNVQIPLVPGMPPGTYRFRVGLFQADTGQRMPVLDAQNRYAGDAFNIEGVEVTAVAAPRTLPQPPFSIKQNILPGLRLVGFERGGREINTGDTLGLGLWWYATQPVPDLHLRLELVRPDNTGQIIGYIEPVHGTFPFTRWAVPQFLIDRASLPLPDDIAAGDYELFLRILNDNDETLYNGDLGALRVNASPRLFTPPAIENPVEALFGREIELLGYNVVQGADDRSFDLTLVWQAQTTPSDDYTVFFHVLNSDGTCCAWQGDRMPQDNSYPTSRWSDGEVVLDTYHIAFPPDAPTGHYTLEVGLYLVESGIRLEVAAPDVPVRDAAYLRPLFLP